MQVKIKKSAVVMSKKRTYLETHVDFGFVFIATDDIPKPQCIFCSKKHGNDSIKPSIVHSHFTLCHSTHVHDDNSFLAKCARFRAAGTLPKLGFCSEDKTGLEASYRVACRIAKEKKPHTIGERLIKPYALDIVELFCGVKQKEKT